ARIGDETPGPAAERALITVADEVTVEAANSGRVFSFVIGGAVAGLPPEDDDEQRDGFDVTAGVTVSASVVVLTETVTATIGDVDLEAGAVTVSASATPQVWSIVVAAAA